jgi:hypothetical protein
MERDMSRNNCEVITIDQAVDIFVDYAQHFDPTAPNNHWYVGISIDPDSRRRAHEREKGITCMFFSTLVFCKNKAFAKTLEDRLENEGFAITEEALSAAMESNTNNMPHGVYIFHADSNASECLKRILDKFARKPDAYWEY